MSFFLLNSATCTILLLGLTFSSITADTLENRGNIISNKTFEMLFSATVSQNGQSYVEAKSKILSLKGNSRDYALKALEMIAQDQGDWERQLTARILLGWLKQLPSFTKCSVLARGELSGTRPHGGFHTKHRAGAIARLGKEVTPCVLEMVYKDRKYIDNREEASLFASLGLLNDSLALMPIIALLNDSSTCRNAKLGALSVLSLLGDEQGLKTVIKIGNNADEDAAVRQTAIRALSGFKQPKAAIVLAEILTSSQRPLADRQAASTGLNFMGNPNTRESVKIGIKKTNDTMIKLTLLNTLGHIGTKDDILFLQSIVNDPNPEIAATARNAIEDILMED